MSDKFNNRYRIASARLSTWDYGSEGAYFVTICTKRMRCFFGSIEDKKMKLSAIGEIVKQEWLKTFEMRPDMNLQNVEYVIMPNHFHAIIIIGVNEYNSGSASITNTPKNKFGPQSKNLASIIGGFKIGVTTNSRKILPSFDWQHLFHDHIIRNQRSFDNISNYIKNNPANWPDDKFYNDDVTP